MIAPQDLLLRAETMGHRGPRLEALLKRVLGHGAGFRSREEEERFRAHLEAFDAPRAVAGPANGRWTDRALGQRSFA